MKEENSDWLWDDGSMEIDGVKCKWYTLLENTPDSDELFYMSHFIMIPKDDLQTMMYIEYDFNGGAEDISQYDNLIKELDGCIHISNIK